MIKGLTFHTKNAYLYDTKEDYLKAAMSKVGRLLSERELQYLEIHAINSDGVKGSQYVWANDVRRVIGSFAVCDHCVSILSKSNDVVTITKPRLGRGVCSICGAGDRVLRGVNVDNYGKVASFRVKVAEILNRGTTVKIVDSPVRFQALIGEIGEIMKVEMSPTRGIRYEIELANGVRIPYEFSPRQLEPYDDSGMVNPVDETIPNNDITLNDLGFGDTATEFNDGFGGNGIAANKK